MIMMKRGYVIVVLLMGIIVMGTLGVGSAQTASQNEDQSEAYIPDDTADESRSADSATQDPEWKEYTLDQGNIRMKFPVDGWEILTPGDLEKKMGQGCIPRQAPEGLLILAQNQEKTAGLYLSKIPDKVVMKDASAMDEYIAKHEQQFQEPKDGPELLKAEISKAGDSAYINRLEFQSRIQNGAGGCTSRQDQPEAEDNMLRHTMVEYLVRPQGHDSAVLYRIIASVKETSMEALMPTVNSAVESFEYQADTAGKFFFPDAPENKLPSLDAQRSSSTPWGIYAIVVVAALYLFRRWKKTKARTAAGIT